MEYLPHPHSQVMDENTFCLSSSKKACKIEDSPVSRDKKSSTPTLKNYPWFDEELCKISNLVKKKKSWKSISKILNLLFHQGKHARRAKECKKKWIFDLQNKTESSWTAEEDKILLEKQSLIGKKWEKISEFFYTRTGRQVKARAKYLKCKKNWQVQNKDILNVNCDESGYFTYEGLDPNLSFKVENLSELRNYGNILANSLFNPEVVVANLVLDDFCSKESDEFY